MSVEIATMGLFNSCCRVGGAPPYRQNYDEQTTPIILVTKVEHKTKKSIDSIKVTLLGDGGNE